MVKIGVLVSGGGTNLQALLDAQKRGEIPDGEISLVIASRKKAYALERARMAGVPALALPRRDYEKTADYDAALLTALQQAEVELVVLAGFLCVLGEKMLRGYEGRIVNVHPSLIPAFCGDGFYGLHVHEAALERGVKVTGATVHLVTEVTDGGPILLLRPIPAGALCWASPPTGSTRWPLISSWAAAPTAATGCLAPSPTASAPRLTTLPSWRTPA